MTARTTKDSAKEMLELAKQEVWSAQYAAYYTQIKNVAVSGKHLRRISNRALLQSADNAEKFITTRKIDSFDSLAKYPELKERMQSLLEQGEMEGGRNLM